MSDGPEVARVRADNPGPFTLSGTNTWLVGRDPCWVVDPGPDLPEHVDSLLRVADDPRVRPAQRERAGVVSADERPLHALTPA